VTQPRLGPYTDVERIASGGQATVYRAVDPETGDTVAVKVLHPHLVEQIDFVQRFEREARMAAAVVHPNVARIYDVGQDGDTHFITLEYLPRDLNELIEAEGALPVSRAIELGSQIASGLAAAHEQGIVHRDIKPQNILLDDDGTAKVTDFGISRAIFLSTMTRTGALMGSPAYMAPEQWEGRADHRSDIYSLGILLYQLVTGEVPFESQESPLHLGSMHRDDPLPVERLRELDLPDRLVRVIEGCTAKDPDERFQSAGAVAEALGAGVVDLPEPTRIALPGAPKTGPPFVRAAAAGLGISAIAAAIAVPLIVFTGGDSSTPIAETVQFDLPVTTIESVVALEFTPEHRAAQVSKLN
jgi:serine/threonine-protein kinase